MGRPNPPYWKDMCGMTVVEKPHLTPPGPVPAWTGPAAWIPLVHYALAVAAGVLAAAHSTFRLTPLVQVVVLVAACVLVVVGTGVYFLERKASHASMLAYLRSVVPDILTVLDDAKGFSPSIADRFGQVEADVAKFGPAAHAIADLVPGHATAQGATAVTPLPVVSDIPVVVASPVPVAVPAPAEQAAPVAATGPPAPVPGLSAG